MSRRTLNILGILILMGITAIISIFAYIYFVVAHGEATVTASAPTLDLYAATPNLLKTRYRIATNAALNYHHSRFANQPSRRLLKPHPLWKALLK